MNIEFTVEDYFKELQLMEAQYGQEEELYPWIYMLLQMVESKTINEQISNFAQTYPKNLKASSNEALLFMRRYRFANCP